MDTSRSFFKEIQVFQTGKGEDNAEEYPIVVSRVFLNADIVFFGDDYLC